MANDAHPSSGSPRQFSGNRRQILAEAISHAAHYLPAQGPLEVFVHHNTLHAFAQQPFHRALAAASQKLGARCYLKEEDYRAAFRSGRITEAEVRSALKTALSPLPRPSLPSAWIDLDELRLRVQLYGNREASPAALQWLVDEGDATRRFRPDIASAQRAEVLGQPGRALLADEASESRWIRSLWQICQERTASPTGSTGQSDSAPPPSRFPRDLLIAVCDEDPNDLVHPALIPLCAAFLDRGQAQLRMPLRAQGFYAAWCHIETTGYVLRSAWERQLGTRIRRTGGVDAETAVLALLGELGVQDDEIPDFIEHALLQLPGWAGMFQRLEGSTQLIGLTSEQPQVRLIDFLAVRLSLDVLAYLDIAQHHGFHGSLSELIPYLQSLPQLSLRAGNREYARAWPLFNVAQLAGLRSDDLLAAPAEAITGLCTVAEQLDPSTRTRIFHEAYERNYRDGILRSLVARRREPRQPPAQPRFSIVCCIDDRMESLRRHIEENHPDIETFGAAGFFNLAIAFQGLDDPATFPLCPVVVQPQHRIVEQPTETDAKRFAQRQRRRQRWQRASRLFASASRSLILGSLLTAVAGWVATLPLLLNVFLPISAARLRKRVTRNLLPEVRTQLSERRTADARAEATADLFEGFSIEEKASRVGTLLENIGMTRSFARVVVIVGHDSSSVNNPHFAAYSCGACGGRSGGPNARLFARMANRKEVRVLLRQRGIDIPDSTWFVGGVHDTCSDSIRLFDEDLASDREAELTELHRILKDVLARNAHERCRRFASASPNASYDDSLAHVEERGADLSQARPELGHATNASAIVGRRSLSHGVFLDRRAFLISYDPTIDPSGAILERILLAVTPVCAGINLEYFFSTVDNERLGAGTKLPHNVTGLIAVMNGASSDLRTGLPKQMIEIHEPVRLQLVLDSTPEIVEKIIARQPSLAEIFNNHWVQLITISPESGAVHLYSEALRFEPWAPAGAEETLPALPRARTSREWYFKKRSFVPPALIDPTLPRSSDSPTTTPSSTSPTGGA